MKYYVSATAKRGGNGSKEKPFKQIGEASKIAKAGDEVIVLPGVYREYVDPKFGGEENAPIIYRSEKPLEAIITGSEKVDNWERLESGIWLAKIPNGVFGSYNPYTTLVTGDWYFSPDPRHTGEIYLNGKSMYECNTLEEVVEGREYLQSWDRDFSTYKWYTEQKDNNTLLYANFHDFNPNVENVEINVRRNCFFPSKNFVNYISVIGFTICNAATTWAPPTAFQDGMIGPNWSKGWTIENCDIYNSKCSGISLGKYLQPNNENKWSKYKVRNGTQTERDAICQAQLEGWVKEKVGSHKVCGCEIHDCEQTGIVGHLGGVFSIIENNHIHHINNKQQLGGAEIGGIKMHAAIDVIYRNNIIHHCTRGLWLDWQAQGTRVTHNLFYNNFPPEKSMAGNMLAIGEDIFVEVSHGPTLIDNNILLSPISIRFSTQGVALVHNLVCGSFSYVGSGTDNGGGATSVRYTPYHVPHRTEVAGFMTFLHGDDRFYNNIFVQKYNYTKDNLPIRDWGIWGAPNLEVGTDVFSDYPTKEEYFAKFAPDAMDVFGLSSEVYYEHLPVMLGGNAYFNGAKPSVNDKESLVNNGDKVFVDLVIDGDKYTLNTNVYDFIKDYNVGIVGTGELGMAIEPEELFENPDGTEIIFNRDYFYENRGSVTIPGPFAKAIGNKEIV